MGLATIFLWFQALNVTKNYRMALTITSIVTFIETYHYSRSFNSWVETFDVQNYGGGGYAVMLTGGPFNDAYRYIDWPLTAHLLPIELILVMKLSEA